MGDLPGHGEQAKNHRYHDEEFKEYYTYAKQLIQIAQADNLPVFIIGNGLGATIAARAIYRHKFECAGLIMVSPWIHLKLEPGKLSKALSSLSAITSNVKLKHEITYNTLTRNFEVYGEMKDEVPFNTMVTVKWYRQLQQLMKTVREEEINLRKTELRALQAQINPHFLYNTLDSISWMCEQGKNAEAVEMVNALARLFRISISRGHELIPIRSELMHAESYLEIQAYRYKNQFRWSIDADESCLDYLCNKITLQPIIENAIYHGLNGLVDDGEILVSVQEDGEDILFTVRDNGSGMTDEQIAAIMQKEQSDRAGIGIKNVNDRLKIYFGPAYGIRIESEPDEGTCVFIRMPKVREEAEYEKK